MTRFVRRRKNGTSRIVRDSYSNRRYSWFEIRKLVLERDNYRCRALVLRDGKYVPCNSTENLEVHHRVPLSKGGKTTPLNLITLCGRCHEARHLHLKR